MNTEYYVNTQENVFYYYSWIEILNSQNTPDLIWTRLIFPWLSTCTSPQQLNSYNINMALVHMYMYLEMYETLKGQYHHDQQGMESD